MEICRPSVKDYPNPHPGRSNFSLHRAGPPPLAEMCTSKCQTEFFLKHHILSRKMSLNNPCLSSSFCNFTFSELWEVSVICKKKEHLKNIGST